MVDARQDPGTPASSRAGLPEDCLAGGGELGALMRSMDWSKTPLGPVASWPQSLRTSVSIMLSSGFAVVVAWGPEFIFLYNDRYRPVLGKTKHPMALGNRSADIFPEVWHFIGPLFRKALAGETVALDDVLIPLDRNGYLEECFFTLSYSPIRDESGGVGGMLAIVAETTERVQGERRLRTLRDLAAIAPRARTAEAACENAARTLAQNPVDVPFALLFLLDPDAKEARLVSYAGLPAAEGFEAGRWPLEEAARAGRAVTIADVSGQSEPLPGGTYPEPTRTVVVLPLKQPGVDRPNGFLVAGVSPRRALDDKYEGFFDLVAEHVATAISNARGHEAERKRAEALAEIDRAKTAFFSNVSHEFRTPLTLMLAPVEDLLARGEAPAEAALIHRNALRLLKLVNTLLDFSRIEAGRAQAVYVPTDLAMLTRDLASSFRAATDRAGLKLEIECPALPEAVYVDRDMWEKIVLNLLSNAFKFTFEGSIHVRLRLAGDHVQLEIADTGTGIAEHELPRVFERFHRIEGARSRSFEGSGIGLALVQELVRMQGGSVQVKSRLGEGSSFVVSVPLGTGHLPSDRIGAARALSSTALGAAPYVEEALRWLPREDAHDPAVASLDRAPEPESRPRRARSATIAVVDDNADMRDYLARVLSTCGDVRTYRDGEEALREILVAPPDLVVTDVMMPNLDGMELLRALRADDRTSRTPVILVSARAGEEARIAGAASGADDYVVKPFSARELAARVNAQLELSRLRGAAESQRRTLYQLFMEAPAAIAIVRGPEHVYELANPIYCELVGRRAEDLLGRPGREALPELDDQGVWARLDRVRTTAQSFMASEFPATLKRPGREQGFFNWVARPVHGDAGEIERILVFAVEVTEQVVARDEAQRLARELERASRAKDEFVAMLGHELRNPLAPISTALRVMDLRGISGGEHERAVIGRQVGHLTRLVDDLLDVSRIASGKVSLSKSQVELADVVARAIEITSPLLEQRNQRLKVTVPRPGLAVLADKERMTQVVCNLLTNAFKYSDPNAEIHVVAEKDGAEVVFRVEDQGVGIEQEMLPRVFDLFSQERQSLARSQGGLGLGLAIVKNLVTMHGGSVSAHSEGRGKGATFTVRLPLFAMAADAGAEPKTPPPVRAAPRSDARNVLIVDDNQDAAESLAAMLTSLGHVTRVAPDGPAALDTVWEFVPDVALLDIGLPVMDGYELARRMRENPITSGAHLFAISGYGQEEDLERSREAGFDAHFVKPVDLDTIVRAVESVKPRAWKDRSDRGASAARARPG